MDNGEPSSVKPDPRSEQARNKSRRSTTLRAITVVGLWLIVVLFAFVAITAEFPLEHSSSLTTAAAIAELAVLGLAICVVAMLAVLLILGKAQPSRPIVGLLGIWLLFFLSTLGRFPVWGILSHKLAMISNIVVAIGAALALAVIAIDAHRPR